MMKKIAALILVVSLFPGPAAVAASATEPFKDLTDLVLTWLSSLRPAGGGATTDGRPAGGVIPDASTPEPEDPCEIGGGVVPNGQECPGGPTPAPSAKQAPGGIGGGIVPNG